MAKELIDVLDLESSNPRRVVSMPRGELGLHVTVGHRDVVTAFRIGRGGSASQDTSPTWDASSPVLVSDPVSDPTKRVSPGGQASPPSRLVPCSSRGGRCGWRPVGRNGNGSPCRHMPGRTRPLFNARSPIGAVNRSCSPPRGRRPTTNRRGVGLEGWARSP